MLKTDPESPTALYFIALAQLGAGNEAEYHRACSRMLARFPVEFDAAPSVVAACTVIPDAVADLTPVRATAQMIHGARVASNARLKQRGPSPRLRVSWAAFSIARGSSTTPYGSLTKLSRRRPRTTTRSS